MTELSNRTDTPTGVDEFYDFKRISGGREFPLKAAMPVPGTVSASNVVVVDANKAVDTLDITTPKVGGTAIAATGAEINRVADVSARIVNLAVSTAITEVAHDSKILVMGGAGTARTHTLPAATGSGARFRFLVGAVNTSNHIINVTGNDTMDGQLLMVTDGGDAVEAFEAASDSDTITLNGTTTGGASIGDWVELIDIAADQWAVTGILTGTGDEVTPFSAAV